MAVHTQLARYRTIATLGSGGMATVVLAEDTVLGRQVALKRIHGAADPQAVARLRREALLGASFSHPNIVAVYDVITSEDGEIVIVMEYVEGETLRDGLERGGRLTPASALAVIDGVAAGLDAIHARGIVHRDVKPANILLGVNAAVKLADLGIASVPDRTRITSVGTVLGSFSYMAPEQLEDGPVTPAIDVYALAAVAYEALGGAKARPETNPIAVAHAIASGPPPDLRQAWPAAPAAAADLLRRAMARDPSRRPQTAGELARSLHGALEPGPAATPAPRAAAALTTPRTRPTGPPPVLEPDRSRAWMVPAVLVAVVALAVALVLALGSSGNSGSPGSSTGGAGRKAAKAPGSSTTHGHATSAAHAPATTSSSHTTSSSQSTSSTRATQTATTSPSSSSAPPAPGTTSSATGASATPPSGASTPSSAVSTFYTLAASHQYPQAWALADPALRQQLGGYESFQSTMAPVRKIIFHTDQVTDQTTSGATVAIRTTSIREGGAQQCEGTVQLVPAAGSGGWVLHELAINCS